MLQNFGAHQQRKYFACKEKPLTPLEKRISGWNEVRILASFDILLKVSPGWDEATKCVSVFEENVWVSGECAGAPTPSLR